MLRGTRNLVVLLVVLWMLLAGFGLLLNVTHRAPPRDCWSSSCWNDKR